MYLGLVLAYLGEMFFLAQLAPLLPLLLVVAYLQWVVIPLEESRLRATFAAPMRDTPPASAVGSKASAPAAQRDGPRGLALRPSTRPLP